MTVWLVVFLFSGQGFRNLLGFNGSIALTVVTFATAIYIYKSVWKKHIPILLTLFVITATASLLWSDYKMETFIGLIILIATTLVGLLVGWAHSWKDTLSLLGKGLQISLVLSLLFEFVVAIIIRQPINSLFVYPNNLVSDSHPIPWSENLLFSGGAIQGFMGNRNLLDFVALLLIVVTIVRLLDKQTKLWQGLFWIALAFITHLLTLSATVSLALIAISIVIIGVKIINLVNAKHRKIVSWSFLGICVAAGLIVLNNYNWIFSFLDRQPNLSNRTDIWKQVINLSLERSEGWGWVGYWPVWAEPFNRIAPIGNVPVSHAHNAFLDVWLQTGVVGVILLISLFFVMLSSSWRTTIYAAQGKYALPLASLLLVTCLLVQSFSESRLLLEGNWFLFVILAVHIPRTFKLVKPTNLSMN